MAAIVLYSFRGGWQFPSICHFDQEIANAGGMKCL